MTETIKFLRYLEGQIERALWDLEVHDDLEKALEIYHDAESKLTALEIPPGDPAFPEQQPLLAYCLMRESNLLRQMDKSSDQDFCFMGNRGMMKGTSCRYCK